MTSIEIPIPSMYGIFTYIWLLFMVNVGKYTKHGCYGILYWDVLLERIGSRFVHDSLVTIQLSTDV